MDGVTILSVVEPADPIGTFLFMLIIGAAVGITVGGLFAFTELEPYYCLMGLVVGALVGAFFGSVLGGVATKEPSQYKVTISEEVNFQEFHNTYDIVSQEGEIYTVKLK